MPNNIILNAIKAFDNVENNVILQLVTDHRYKPSEGQMSGSLYSSITQKGGT